MKGSFSEAGNKQACEKPSKYKHVNANTLKLSLCALSFAVFINTQKLFSSRYIPFYSKHFNLNHYPTLRKHIMAVSNIKLTIKSSS